MELEYTGMQLRVGYRLSKLIFALQGSKFSGLCPANGKEQELCLTKMMEGGRVSYEMQRNNLDYPEARTTSTTTRN